MACFGLKLSNAWTAAQRRSHFHRALSDSQRESKRAFILKFNEKEQTHEHKPSDRLQGDALLSHDSIATRGCALRRGQVHRTDLKPMRAMRALSWPTTTCRGPFFCAIEIDPTFGG